MNTKENAMSAVDEAQLDPIDIEERITNAERGIIHLRERITNAERRLIKTEELLIIITVAFLLVIWLSSESGKTLLNYSAKQSGPNRGGPISNSPTSLPSTQPSLILYHTPSPTQTYANAPNKSQSKKRKKKKNGKVSVMTHWSPAMKKKNGKKDKKKKADKARRRSEHLANNNHEWSIYTFVHVGKCAGGNAFSVLKEQGILYSQVHTRKVTVEQDITNKSALIVAVRDPLNRTISAFNWRKPTSGFVEQTQLTRDEKRLYRCFESVNDFANALNGTNTCSKKAKASLTTDCDYQCYGHLSMGLRYYFSNSEVKIQLEQKKFPVWLVHAEHFERDMKRVVNNIYGNHSDAALPVVEGNVSEKQEARLHSTEHASNSSKSSTYLDARGRELLMTHLSAEYKFLRLLEMANSLDIAK